MSTPSPYSGLATLISAAGFSASPAELHGLLLGRSCAGSDFDAQSWLADAAELLDGEPVDGLRQELLGLLDIAKNELSGGDMTLTLLLPSDEAPLAERSQALGQWCHGFLAGFGLISGNAALSAEAMEVLQDLASIAQIEGDLEEAEDAESDYMEVTEYLRVAPLLLFVESRKVPTPSTPSIH